MKEQSKIIAVGFHKTGLTSLYNALQILGYRITKGKQSYKNIITSSTVIELLNKKEYSRLFACLEKYDAVIDNPWNILYEAMDQQFPDSKFIFTYREENDWLSSAKRYFKHRPDTLIRRWVYGEERCCNITDEQYIKRYRAHNEAVLKYFEGRSDFLKLNIFDNEGWEKLCPFLEKPVVYLPFPHNNKNRAEME